MSDNMSTMGNMKSIIYKVLRYFRKRFREYSSTINSGLSESVSYFTYIAKACCAEATILTLLQTIYYICSYILLTIITFYERAE